MNGYCRSDENCKCFCGSKIEWLRSAACGFLLSRGISGAALSARWSMASVVGDGRSDVLAARLFLAGCGLMCLVRKGYGERACIAADYTAAALCTVQAMISGVQGGRLWFAAGDTALLITALVLCSGRKNGWLMLLMTAAIFIPMPPDSGTVLRLEAICCSLACAGLCSAAMSAVCGSEREIELPWLIAGVTAGML